MRRGIYLAVALLAALLGGCEFPRDADGTWQRVRETGLLRVGFVESPPWVARGAGEPSGLEPRLLAQWAEELGAKIEWTAGSEANLIESLRARRLDVVIGGHLHNSAWTEHAAPTQSYIRTSVVVGFPREHGDAAALEIEGRRIAYQPLRPDLAAKIEERGGVPEPANDRAGRLAAIYPFEADSLGLAPGPVLTEEKHVMFAAKGESRFLLELDRFLARAAPVNPEGPSQ